MKQSAIIKAYKSICKLGQQDLPIRLAFDLFKIKQMLQPHWDFQVSEEEKASAAAKKMPDGSVTFSTKEEADTFRQRLKDLGGIDVELKVKPVRIPLSLPGLMLSMDDIAALEGFVQFLNENKKGE